VLETRAGRVDLKIPKLRQGSYFPNTFESRGRAEKALVRVIMSSSRRCPGKESVAKLRSMRVGQHQGEEALILRRPSHWMHTRRTGAQDAGTPLDRM